MGNCIDRKNTPHAYEVSSWMQTSVQNWCESQVEKSHRPTDSCLPVELILVSCKGDLEGTQLNTRSSPRGPAVCLIEDCAPGVSILYLSFGEIHHHPPSLE